MVIQSSDWTFLMLISLSLSQRLLGMCAFPCAYLIMLASRLGISPITSFSDYVLRCEFWSEIIPQPPFFLSIFYPNLFLLLSDFHFSVNDGVAYLLCVKQSLFFFIA